MPNLIATSINAGGYKNSTICVQQKVMFSEVPILIAFALAFFISMSHAIVGVDLKNILFFKHIPLVIFLPAFAFYVFGRLLSGMPEIYSKGWRSYLWPLLALGVFSTIGSLYARFELDTRETFLVLGLYLLLTPLFFVWGRELGNAKKIVKPFVFIWGVSSGLATLGAIATFGKAEVLHEIEFLVISFYVYLFFAIKNNGGKTFAFILIVCVTILTQKLTGYIIGIVAMSYIGVVYAETTVSLRWKAAMRVSGILFLVGVICLGGLGFFYFREYLPSGNTDVRLHQYEKAFSAFLDSPVWGQAYTSGSGEVFVQYIRSFNIPTHSDILDLLKQGGVIALLLWLSGIWISVRSFIRCALSNLQAAAFFHAMAFMMISMALSCAINPLLLKPSFAFLIWGGMAMALGIVTDTRKGQFNEK